MDQAEIGKSGIPGCTDYKLGYDWKENPDFNHAKMGLGLKNERRTFAGEIYADSKIPEKTSPGPAAYENHK